ENLAVGWRFQIEHDRFLAAVHAGKIGRLAPLERSVLPGVVTALRRLDLDHPRPQLGQKQRAVRPGENAREVDNRDAGEWSSLGHAGRSLLNRPRLNNPEQARPQSSRKDPCGLSW